MEGKTMAKLTHVVALLLLASLFEPLTARDLVLKAGSDEIEVLRLPLANEDQVEAVNPSCTGKHSWPELVGTPVKTAKKIIEKENPAAKVQILLPGMPATQDFVCGRVRIAASWNLIVLRTPTMEVCCW